MSTKPFDSHDPALRPGGLSDQHRAMRAASTSLKGVLVAALMMATGAALAQVGNGGGLYSDLKVTNYSAQLLPKFVVAAQTAAKAEAKMLEVFGAGDESARLSAAALQLSASASRSRYEQVIEARLHACKMLSLKLATPVRLSNEAKEHLSVATEALVQAVKQYEEMSSDLQTIKQGLREEGQEGQRALYVVKTIPLSLQEMRRVLNDANAFSKANAVAPPSELNGSGLVSARRP